MSDEWAAVKPPEHENCEAPWYCGGCGEPVCPRCVVSSGEAVDLCPTRWEKAA